MAVFEERRKMACPYNGKTCISGVRADFQDTDEVGQKIKCRMWVGVKGKDPTGEKILDYEDCSFAWQVTTHVEMSQTNRFVAASSDKFANKVSDTVDAYQQLSKALRVVGDEFRLLNENMKKLPAPKQNGILDVPPNGTEGHSEE